MSILMIIAKCVHWKEFIGAIILNIIKKKPEKKTILRNLLVTRRMKTPWLITCMIW
jgi:hypothetical protein